MAMFISRYWAIAEKYGSGGGRLGSTSEPDSQRPPHSSKHKVQVTVSATGKAPPAIRPMRSFPCESVHGRGTTVDLCFLAWCVVASAGPDKSARGSRRAKAGHEVDLCHDSHVDGHLGL